MAFLKRYRLLDMAPIGPGPFCAQMLGHLGFDVIKISAVPKGGGRQQSWAPAMILHEPVPMRWLGEPNARGIALDLKNPEGREIFFRMVQRADVILEGFRPGVVDRLGVGYRAVRAVKSDIVYASISGYGQNGPYRDLAGHDLNYLAIAGFIHVNGRPGGEPVIPGALIADYAAGGMSAVVHVLAALLRREVTGEGTYCDISMTDAAFQLNSLAVGAYLASGLEPRRGEIFTAGFWPWYDVYQTKDGKYISIAAIEPWFYEAFCRAIGREDLLDKQWSLEHREQIGQELREMFRSRTRDEWTELFRGVDTCFAPVNSISEAVNDPQIRARGMITEVEHPDYGRVTAIGSMLKLDGTRREARTWLTRPGQHTDEILEEHGFSRQEIEALRGKGVIA